MVIFLSYILVQLYKVFRRIFRKRIDGILFLQITMLTLDITFAVLYFMRSISLATAINEFELDPRGKPNFTEVFVLQENIVSMVGIALWLHTVYLIYVLSSVNHVYVFPMLMRMVKSPMINLFVLIILPIQIGMAIGGVIVFGDGSYMMKRFTDFFVVVLWQGYLRPVDLREEIDKMNPDLQVWGQLFHLTLNLMMVFFAMNFLISFINDAHLLALVSTTEIVK